MLKVNLHTSTIHVVAEDPHYDVTATLFHPSTGHLEAVGLDRERFEWVYVAPDSQKNFTFLQEKLKTPFQTSSCPPLIKGLEYTLKNLISKEVYCCFRCLNAFILADLRK